jgi:uncharacterized protein
MTTAVDSKQVVLGALQAAMAGDMEGFKSALHPEVVVHEPPYLSYGGDYHGHQGFLDLFGIATSVLDLSTIKLLATVADGDRVVLLMSIQLASTREERIVTEHWVLRDGLVADVRVFWFGLESGSVG